MSTTRETTEDLQRVVAEQTAVARQAQAELDRRTAAAAAAAKAEQEAADRARVANARTIEQALEQRGRDAEADAVVGLNEGDLSRAYVGFTSWLGSRQARQYHRDDTRAASGRLGQPDPYPNDLRHVQITFWDFIENHVGDAVSRAAIDHLEQLGIEH